MTADSQKKHRWFQVHLSTACILMLVAGVLVWLNAQTHQSVYFFWGNDGQTADHEQNWGWPLHGARQRTPIQFQPAHDPSWLVEHGHFIKDPITHDLSIKSEGIARVPSLPIPQHVCIRVGQKGKMIRPSKEDRIQIEDMIVWQGYPPPNFSIMKLDAVSIGFNCGCALAILAATAFACEWLIRRHEGKQQEPQP